MHDEEDRAATLRRHHAEEGQRKGTIAAVVAFVVTAAVVGVVLYQLLGVDQLMLGGTLLAAGLAARAAFFRYAARLGGGLDESPFEDREYWGDDTP